MMKDTLEKVGGYGCAAVHIGILRRAIVVLDDSGIIEIVNPIIMEMSMETQKVKEGSIAPDSPRGTVIRPKSVTVTGLDRNGEPMKITANDFLAATLCHEIDHLDGILFTDKIEMRNGK